MITREFGLTLHLERAIEDGVSVLIAPTDEDETRKQEVAREVESYPEPPWLLEKMSTAP